MSLIKYFLIEKCNMVKIIKNLYLIKFIFNIYLKNSIIRLIKKYIIKNI